MRFTLRKMLSFLSAVAILCALLPVGASTAVENPEELLDVVGVSRAEPYAKSGSDVVALAFRFRMFTTGLTYGKNRVTDYSKAVVEFNGETYRLEKMGAVFTNKEDIGNNPNRLIRENHDGKNVTNLEAKYLFKASKNYGEYVARIVNIPKDKGYDTLIYVRPYFVYTNSQGKPVTVYSEIVSANASGKKVRYSTSTASLSISSRSLAQMVSAVIRLKSYR